jgi:hypothetical protein
MDCNEAKAFVRYHHLSRYRIEPRIQIFRSQYTSHGVSRTSKPET